MQTFERKIASFQQNGTRLQLLQIANINTSEIYYEVRLNRKIVSKSKEEYKMRKLFAAYAQNIILQLKLYNFASVRDTGESIQGTTC